MIACLLIPGFELRAALRAKPRLATCPAALAPEAGEEQLLGPVTAAAQEADSEHATPVARHLSDPSVKRPAQDEPVVMRAWQTPSPIPETTHAQPTPDSHAALSPLAAQSAFVQG